MVLSLNLMWVRVIGGVAFRERVVGDTTIHGHWSCAKSNMDIIGSMEPYKLIFPLMITEKKYKASQISKPGVAAETYIDIQHVQLGVIWDNHKNCGFRTTKLIVTV